MTANSTLGGLTTIIRYVWNNAQVILAKNCSQLVRLDVISDSCRPRYVIEHRRP